MERLLRELHGCLRNDCECLHGLYLCVLVLGSETGDDGTQVAVRGLARAKESEGRADGLHVLRRHHHIHDFVHDILVDQSMTIQIDEQISNDEDVALLEE